MAEDKTVAETVRLRVPADAAYARPVRMLAANLAVLCGMSVDGVEDVRMAAEEGFVWCCATRPEACELSFTAGPDELTMSFGLGSEEIPEDDEASTYAALILSAVCDAYELDRAAGVLRLRKGTDVADA